MADQVDVAAIPPTVDQTMTTNADIRENLEDQNEELPEGVVPLGADTTVSFSGSYFILFLINTFVVALVFIGFLQIEYKRISTYATRLSLLGTICSAICSLYRHCGKPKTWSMQEIKHWSVSIASLDYFAYLLYSLVLVPCREISVFAVLPVLYRLLPDATAFVCDNFDGFLFQRRRRWLRQTFQWPAVNSWRLISYSTNIQIGLGFLISLSVFSWKTNIILTSTCWHLLIFLNHPAAIFTCHQEERRLNKIRRWLRASLNKVIIFSTNIRLGYLISPSIFLWQNKIIFVFVYWHMLKYMYHAPSTRAHHQNAWKKLSKIVRPYIYLYVLFLKSPLTAARRMRTSRRTWGIPREETEARAIPLNTRALLVIGIPERASLLEIRRCFQIYGEVAHICLMRRQSHTMRNTYGKVVFLSFRRSESTASALQCSTYILGRRVQVFKRRG